jgi:hypothetical protein
MRGYAVVAFLGLSLFALGSSRADDADPPGRVARLSDIEGSVSMQPAGVEEWTAPSLNRPVTTGDKLWADQGSRAELDFGDAAIRLGATTGFSFLNLDDNTAQMQVTAGTLLVHLRNLQPNQTYEIDTPNIALSLLQPGDYRVEVDDAGDTTVVKVSSGQAQATGGGQSVSVATQQMATFAGTTTVSYASATLGAPDDLDSWSAGRERQREESASRQYVADDVPGTADLDTNGRWEQTPEYGYVWTPTVVMAGWAPYRFGNWVWIAPWGWTWVDAAPWGYAPFHYGRWVTWNSAWCWVPGPRRVRPVYGPALVAWVGGPHVTVSVGIGPSVGWFPLAPREVYVPGYHVSETYVRNVNITNTTIVNNTYITNVYRNTNVTNIHYVNETPAAVTAVPQSVFASGQRVGGHVLKVPREVLTSAAVTPAAPAIVPVRQSVLGAGAGRSVSHPPPSLLNRTVVARTAPPHAPVPFERQVEAIRANGGRPLPRTELARLEPATPAASVRLIGGGSAESGRMHLPATPSRASAEALARPRGAAAPAASPAARSGGAGAPNFADRERVLQNSQVAPGARADRPPSGRAEPSTTARAERADSSREQGGSAKAPSGQAPPAREWRNDRPPSAQQPHAPATQQQGFHSDDPTHTRGRPPSTPGSGPAPAPVQEERYRAPAPAAAPSSVREAPPPSAPPAYRPQEHPVAAAPPPGPPPAHRPQERSAAPPPAPRAQESKPAPRAQESKPEPRDTAPHGDRTSRERGER